MEIQKYTTGMIFSLDDRNYGDLDGKEYRHYYVVVGTPVDNDHKNFYQCMTITSLHNKEVLETDIPIVLNGKISYINTTNISSFSEQRLDDQGSFSGIIKDERYMSKSEMIKLLTESWMSVHWTGMDDKLYYSICEKISEYKKYFYKLNSRVGEYRDTKVFNQMDAALNDSGVKEQLNIGMVIPVSKTKESKEDGKIIDKMVKEQKVVVYEPIVAKGAKHGKQKECPQQTVKFILRQLHEIEEGKQVSKCCVKTLSSFIETYEEYGPSFFIKNSKRFKGKNTVTIKYHYDNAIKTLNSIMERSVSKEYSGGGGSKTSNMFLVTD